MTLNVSEIKWKSVSLTHVEYPEGMFGKDDILGLLLAWSSLFPIFILVSFATLIVFRRDLHTICFLIGIVFNEGLNYSLKHVVKEYRPKLRTVVYTEYGMPSSHAQFMSFFATYMILFLYLRVHHNLTSMDNLWKHFVGLSSISAACLVCCSRVYLMYHSIEQVVWGAIIGCTFGSFWFLLVNSAFTNYFPIICSWPISEYFLIRDLTNIPNVLWFEYCSQRTEAKSRQRKMSNKNS